MPSYVPDEVVKMAEDFSNGVVSIPKGALVQIFYAYPSGAHYEIWSTPDRSIMPREKVMVHLSQIEKTTDQPIRILREGVAICELEPMGASGLEGYTRGIGYRFQEMDSRGRGGHIYFRVYPESDRDYYETCGRSAFARFFKIKSP